MTRLNYGDYRPQLRFGGYFEDEKREPLPDYTGEYLQILRRPLRPGLIEFISTVIIGVMGYGKTVLARWIAAQVIDHYGGDRVNAIMNRSADLEALLDAMDDRPVQLLFLDDSFGEMPPDIAKKFVLIRHRFRMLLEEAGRPESGVIIALFGIQDAFTLDKLARRVSTATIAKSSSGDQWYKNSLRQVFTAEGVRELDRITRKVTRNYDQEVKSRSVITITGYDRPGVLESGVVDADPFTEVAPVEHGEEQESDFTYDVAGGFVENVQRLIRSRMPRNGGDCALLYPWVIQGTPGTHIASLYPEMGSERTMQRRIADLLEFLHSPETARVIGLEVFEPWFRSRMRDLGHSVTSSESTARGGVDAVVDGVVHSLKCYHQNRNTISIPPTEISADEFEAAQLKGYLRLVVMNPFWGTNPRVAELTIGEMRRLTSVTVTPDLPELDLASAAMPEEPTDPAPSQPHTGGARAEEEAVDGLVRRVERILEAGRVPEPGPGEPPGEEAEPGAAEESGVETADVTSPDPVPYFLAAIRNDSPMSPGRR